MVANGPPPSDARRSAALVRRLNGETLLVLAIMLVAAILYILSLVLTIEDIMVPDDPTGVLPISAIKNDVGCGV